MTTFAPHVPPWRQPARVFEGDTIGMVPLPVAQAAKEKCENLGAAKGASVNKVVEIRPSVWQCYVLNDQARYYDRLSREAREESVFMRDKGNRELSRLRERDSDALRRLADEHTLIVTVTA